MKPTFIGLIIGFSLAGNLYAVALHTGKVLSEASKKACEYEDLTSALQRGSR